MPERNCFSRLFWSPVFFCPGFFVILIPLFSTRKPIVFVLFLCFILFVYKILSKQDPKQNYPTNFYPYHFVKDDQKLFDFCIFFKFFWRHFRLWLSRIFWISFDSLCADNFSEAIRYMNVRVIGWICGKLLVCIFFTLRYLFRYLEKCVN